MVLVSDVDFSHTLSDGAEVLINIYYDDGDSNRPIVGLGHGSGGSRANQNSNAQGLANNGFLAFSYDARGEGAGRTGNAASLGSKFWSARDLLDQWEVLDAVIARHSDKVNVDKIGWAGTSQGAIHSWAMMALSGADVPSSMRQWRSAPFRKITAISPFSYEPWTNHATTAGGLGFADPLMNLFQDLSASTTYEPTHLAAVKEAVNAGFERYQKFVTGDTAVYKGLDGFYERILANYHTHVLAYMDWDDNWASCNLTADLIRRLNNRGTDFGSGTIVNPHAAAVFGSVGAHQATAVASEGTQQALQRIAFFESTLLDDDSGIAAVFGEGSPATWYDVPEIQFSITPNTEADYQETAGAYVDTTYSRAKRYVNDADFFLDCYRSDVNADAAVLYLTTSNTLAASAGTAGTKTINNNWTTATTLADYTTNAATGTANATYVGGRITVDNEDFTIAWPNANDALLAGTVVAELYASALKPGALLNAELIYSTGSGAVTQYVCGGHYRFPGDYPPGEIRRIQLVFDANAFHLNGAAGVALTLRVNNVAHKSPPYTGFVGGLRAHPDFEENQITLYVGGSVADSRVFLPLHNQATVTLDS